MEEVYERMIAANEPNERARTLLAETTIVLMVGMSGVGRDTIINQLVARGGYYPLLTATTRPMRINNGVMERDGVEYRFLSTEQAVEYLQAGEYVEVSPVHDHINGLLVDELQRAHDSGQIAITDMDPQGAAKYRTLSDAVIPIFVLPPTYDAWMNRMRERYDSPADFNAAWPRRRQSAIMELGMALDAPFYRFVVNDELSEAVVACDQIAHGHVADEATESHNRELAHSLLDQLTNADS